MSTVKLDPAQLAELAKLITQEMTSTSQGAPKPSKCVTLAEAVCAFLKSKKESGLRPATLSMYRYYLGRFFKGREDLPIGSITEQDIMRWFEERKETPSARQSNFGRMSAFFSFAVRRRWIQENPCDFCERPKVHPQPPQTLTMSQVEDIMRFAEEKAPHMLLFLSLGLLLGIRPDEVGRLRWVDVDLEQRSVTVSIAASKVHHRRLVDIPPNAMEWLKLAKHHCAKEAPSRSTRIRWLKRLRKVLQLRRWPKDVLRHTCATFALAKTKDAGAVALQLGNSQAILLEHYKGLARESDGIRFYELRPARATLPDAAER